ncbi:MULTISPECIES: helix-turn-helix transcriptional regulator [Agrobacterium]|jgi:predicted DNA-binding transcriptional regulator YafY|uniref:HTH domain protein n=1 Tax=Agrobacterium rosae TaxID=1972867 RepID=A0A1R3U085_9HYPH|nr:MULTISPECIES: YafY family protein [Agrobacterium]UHS61314.1 YafY family transcriptional regulator [Agrobacterium vaccinii]SCX34019.1 HTH domain protein [Agrobacterium rosae]
MRRADRLFDIIQALRGTTQPTTAAALAQKLEVTPRTIYRDIATLQARRIPIEGEPGLGYFLRKGFDLPPLMFTMEEIEAITVGANLVQRIRDPKLQEAAESVLNKLQHTVPKELRSYLASPRFYVSEGDAVRPEGIELLDVRNAIRTCRKISISYIDDQQRRSQRTIWPVATVYYVDVTLIAAWCELRGDYRHFRADRILQSKVLDDRFAADSSAMMAEWMATRSQKS